MMKFACGTLHQKCFLLRQLLLGGVYFFHKSWCTSARWLLGPECCRGIFFSLDGKAKRGKLKGCACGREAQNWCKVGGPCSPTLPKIAAQPWYESVK